MDKRIVEFLIKAKKATYAGKGSETSSSRKKSHDLTYQEGNLMYYDTYLGSKNLQVKKLFGLIINHIGA